MQIGGSPAQSLSNLKVKIDAGSGNPDATVPPAYRNDTTETKFRVDGKKVGVDVPVSESTSQARLKWTGLTGTNLTRLQYMAAVNVPGVGAARGALEVRHIGTDLPTLNLLQGAPGAMVMQAVVENDAQPRFWIAADGSLNWGPGASATDVSLSRAETATGKGALALGAPAEAPLDGNLSNSKISFWLEEPNNLKVRVKLSNGTLKTATIPLQ